MDEYIIYLDSKTLLNIEAAGFYIDDDNKLIIFQDMRKNTAAVFNIDNIFGFRKADSLEVLKNEHNKLMELIDGKD